MRRYCKYIDDVLCDTGEIRFGSSVGRIFLKTVPRVKVCGFAALFQVLDGT